IRFMSVYFLHELRFYGPEAGYKARNDAYLIMTAKHQVLVVEIPLWGSIVTRAMNLMPLVRFLLTLKNNDVLIFNFPLLKPFWHALFLAKKIFKFRLVPLIHDIDELRGGKGNDVAELANCDLLISQNEVMTDFLSSRRILRSRIVNLD